MVDRRKPSIYEGIERGNIRLRPSEVSYYEKIIEYIRDHPGCTRKEVEENVGYHSTSTLIAFAIQTGKVNACGHTPQKLEVIE